MEGVVCFPLSEFASLPPLLRRSRGRDAAGADAPGTVGFFCALTDRGRTIAGAGVVM